MDDRVASRAGTVPQRHSLMDGVTWLTILLVLLLLIPSRLVFAPLGSIGAPSQVFALLSLLWWLWHLLTRWGGSAPHIDPIGTAMGLFLASIAVSYILAMLRPIESDEVSTADAALIGAAAWAGTFFVARDGIPSRNRFDTLVHRLTIGAGLLALLGLIQFATGQTLVDRISIPGLSANSVAGSFDRSGFTRPSGTATHPIEFGVILTMLLPLALHWTFYGKHTSALRRWLPTLAIGLIIPLSLSRSVIVGTAVCLVVLLPTWPRARRLMAFGGIAVLMVFVFATVPGILGTVREMFTGIAGDPSAQSRSDSYPLVWEFVTKAPFFGRGLGTFLPKYWILDNQILLFLVSLGFVGLIAFFGLVLAAMLSLAHLRGRSSDQVTRDLAQSLVASLAAGTVGLALFDGFSFPMTAGVFFLLLGMSSALVRLANDVKPFPYT